MYMYIITFCVCEHFVFRYESRIPTTATKSQSDTIMHTTCTIGIVIASSAAAGSEFEVVLFGVDDTFSPANKIHMDILVYISGIGRQFENGGLSVSLPNLGGLGISMIPPKNLGLFTLLSC